MIAEEEEGKEAANNDDNFLVEEQPLNALNIVNQQL